MTLIEQIRKLYATYPTDDIIAAMVQYRREMNLIQEVTEIDEKIIKLKKRRRDITGSAEPGTDSTTE